MCSKIFKRHANTNAPIVFNLQRITFSFASEEAMFVELVKVCIAEKKYSVLEKIEHCSL